MTSISNPWLRTVASIMTFMWLAQIALNAFIAYSAVALQNGLQSTSSLERHDPSSSASPENFALGFICVLMVIGAVPCCYCFAAAVFADFKHMRKCIIPHLFAASFTIMVAIAIAAATKDGMPPSDSLTSSINFYYNIICYGNVGQACFRSLDLACWVWYLRRNSNPAPQDIN